MKFAQIWLGNVNLIAQYQTDYVHKHFKSKYDRVSTVRILLKNAYSQVRKDMGLVPRKAKNSNGSFGIEFISWLPDADAKAAIKEYATQIKDIAAPLEDLMQNGLKFSATYDGDNDTFIVAMTNKDGVEEFRNHCITFRHRDMFTCFCIAIWFELEYSQGDWSIVGDTSRYDW